MSIPLDFPPGLSRKRFQSTSLFNIVSLFALTTCPNHLSFFLFKEDARQNYYSSSTAFNHCQQPTQSCMSLAQVNVAESRSICTSPMTKNGDGNNIIVRSHISFRNDTPECPAVTMHVIVNANIEKL